MLTTDQVISLAPDAASTGAARGLMKASKWIGLGTNTQGLWGECQGSGTKPYQVLVDLDSAASKCSCPSRKHPCKHILALMLMYAESVGTFNADMPVWFQEWHTNRLGRVERKASKDSKDSKDNPDPAKQAQKTVNRLERMRTGADELNLWMRDLLREGIADLPNRPASFWRDIAARMVDAQAPGLARRLEELSSLAYTGPDWPRKVLAQLGLIRILLAALSNYANLNEQLQADVRTALGWAQDKETAINGESVTDVWTVAGVVFTENSALTERRVWLLGENSARIALILDFSHGGKQFEQGYILGTKFSGTLGFFPSAAPQRALILAITSSLLPALQLPLAVSFSENLEQASNAVAANPFLWRLPMSIDSVKLAMHNGVWKFLDNQEQVIPTRIADAIIWKIAAISGGLGIPIFGEWVSGEWLPLAAYYDGWLDLTVT